jgi:hypothetical protein
MAYNTVILKDYSKNHSEMVAAATIVPGMLLQQNNTAKVQAHATSGGNHQNLFAVEDALQGNGLEDAYAAEDPVQVWLPKSGDEVYAILADGEIAEIGAALESNGDGYLKAHTAQALDSAEDQAAATIYSNPIVGYAVERKDLSGSSGEGSAGESSIGVLGYNKRIAIRIA